VFSLSKVFNEDDAEMSRDIDSVNMTKMPFICLTKNAYFSLFSSLLLDFKVNAFTNIGNGRGNRGSIDGETAKCSSKCFGKAIGSKLCGIFLCIKRKAFLQYNNSKYSFQKL
jgi:hypothetical protein